MRVVRCDRDVAISKKGMILVETPLASLKSKALAAIESGNRAGALEHIKAAALETDGVAMLTEMAAEVLAHHRLDEAEAIYRELVAFHPANPAAWRGLAWVAERRGNRLLALEHFQAALALQPDNPWAAQAVAGGLQLLGRLEEAEKAFRAIVAKHPDVAATWRGLARVVKSRGDPVKALEYFGAAAELEPDGGATLEMTTTLRELDRLDEAAAKCRELLARNPALSAAWRELGFVSRRRGDREAALKHFLAAYALDAGDLWSQMEAANELFDLGQTENAERTYLEIVAKAPHLFAARRALATIARNRGDRQLALEQLRAVAELEPNNSTALINVATELRELGAYDEAKMLLSRASELAPKNAHPHVELAVLALARQDLAGAAVALEQALTREPLHRDAWTKKAALLARQHDDEGALAIYARLRSEQPDQQWPYLAAADLMSKAGNVECAFAMLAAARNQCKPSAAMDCREAAILRDAGLLDRSYEVLRSSTARFPGDVWPWQVRTALAIELGLFDEAEGLLGAPPAAAAGVRREAQRLRAKLHKARWKIEAAIETMDAVIDCDESDASAREERAKMRLMMFDIAGAWSDLSAAAVIRSRAAPRKINPMHSLTGQLYEEFILDRALADRLKMLRETPPGEAIGAWLELVRGFPDSTAPAVGLLIALRRAGKFDRTPLTAATPGISQRITHFWNDPQPPQDVAPLMTSWREAEPDFVIESFNDATALTWLCENSAAPVADAFRRAREPAQRADLFRLARLAVIGGWFIDADDRARGGLSGHVATSACFFAHQEEPGSLGNNVLGATPGHPAITRALEEACAAILRGDREIVWLTTGPGLLTRAFANWLAQEPERLDENLAGAAIPTIAQMREIAAIHCNVAYKRSGRAWLSGAFSQERRGRGPRRSMQRPGHAPFGIA
jgi:tetratricopeptide (TPR) repeat protein